MLKVKNNRRTPLILYYALAFSIPFFVIVLSYLGLHISPFGDKTLIISDAKALYMSDLSYIKRVLSGQENLLYSFEQGIGLNLMGTHSGLLNPANVIVLFFDITGFPAMYSWLMAIDIAFCGLTMFIFLSSVYEKNSYILLFSTAYALVGFNVAYCFHYNFLLSVELLPLIALGIKKILDGKSPWLYLISLSYSILASFYFGYMLCIASFVLFLMWYVEGRRVFSKAQKKEVWIKYIGTSITAGLLPAFMWIPTLLSFSGGRMEQNSIFDFTMSENMSISDVFAKLFIGANNTNELVNGQPNIFCGTLVIFLVVAFFIDKRNSFRAKVIRALPISFYFITFYVRAFSMIMQGFSATNWFNYRYSFVFSFLLIFIAVEEFIQIRDIEVNDFKRSCIVFLAIVVLVFTQRYSFVSGGWMLLDLLILAGCLGAIWWNRKDETKAPKRILAVLLVLFCGIECYANYVVCTYQITDWGFKEKEYQKELFTGSVLAESLIGADQTFYRMANEHQTNEQCNNDPRLFGYNGVNYFGSCEQTFVFQGMSRLGLPWWSNRMWYAKGEPKAFDCLFGLKYIISERDLTTEKGYDSKAQIENNVIYQNGNALPVGVISNNGIQDVVLDRNPFQNQNNLWNNLTGLKKNVFEMESNISFTFHSSNDGETIQYNDAIEFSSSVSMQEKENTSNSDSVLFSEERNEQRSDVAGELTDEAIVNSGRYIECSFSACQDGNIYSYSGASVDDNSGSTTENMKYLGYYKKGDTVTDYIALNTDISMDIFKGICSEYYVAYSNDDVLTEYCSILQSKAGTIEKITDSHLAGSVSPHEDSRLFFTIPYDEGWTLKVDGEEVKLENTADLFMSAPISSGSHFYELVFFPRGMKLGIMVSGVALILLILLIVYNTILGKKREMMVESITENSETIEPKGQIRGELTLSEGSPSDTDSSDKGEA